MRTYKSTLVLFIVASVWTSNAFPQGIVELVNTGFGGPQPCLNSDLSVIRHNSRPIVIRPPSSNYVVSPQLVNVVPVINHRKSCVNVEPTIYAKGSAPIVSIGSTLLKTGYGLPQFTGLGGCGHGSGCNCAF